LPLDIILELIVTNLAYMVVLAAPMATLVACLMAYGKFTELNELTALRAAGVNPIHIINPVLGVAAVLTIGLVLFGNYVLPDANQRARSLFIDIRLKKPGFDLKSNEFYDGIEGYTFLVKNVDNESDSLYDVTLFQKASSKQKKAFIRADRGSLLSEDDGQTLTLQLFDGSILRYMDRFQDGRRIDIFEESDFERYRISFDLSELAFSRSNPDQHSRNDRTMNINAMHAVVDSLRREITDEKNKLVTSSQHIVLAEEDSQFATRRNIYTPGRSESNDGAEIDSAEIPYRSHFEVLNAIDQKTAQRRLHQTTLGDLRTYKSTLQNLEVNINWREGRIARYLVEIHKKFSIPIACIIFVLIGAPIGMYTRKGNLGYAALISTGFLTFYFISLIQGEKLADRLFISPATGMWFSNVVLGIVGIYLVIRFCTSFKISNLWRSRD
jgi:lipopolysaccharide export system permease protein